MRQKIVNGILLTKPTRDDIVNLQVGDKAPNCFGKMGTVTEIFGKGIDVNGKAYVCYYVTWYNDKHDPDYSHSVPTSVISQSLKENEIVSTLQVCDKYNQAELAENEFVEAKS